MKKVLLVVLVSAIILSFLSCTKEDNTSVAVTSVPATTVAKTVEAEKTESNPVAAISTESSSDKAEEQTPEIEAVDNEKVTEEGNETADSTTEQVSAEQTIPEDVVEETVVGEFGRLDVQDYYGNLITAEIFKDYKVTMINVFTTWCTWCIEEMPDLEEFSKNMPEGSKMIAVCADAFNAPDDLKAIIERFKITFPVLKMTDSQLSEISYIIGYPTTFYVDRNGTILDRSIGMPSNGVAGYRTKVEKLLAK